MVEEEQDNGSGNLVVPSKWWYVSDPLALETSLNKFLGSACLKRAAFNDVKLKSAQDACPFPYILGTKPEATFARFEIELQGFLGVKSKTKNVFSPDSLQGKQLTD